MCYRSLTERVYDVIMRRGAPLLRLERVRAPGEDINAMHTAAASAL